MMQTLEAEKELGFELALACSSETRSPISEKLITSELSKIAAISRVRADLSQIYILERDNYEIKRLLVFFRTSFPAEIIKSAIEDCRIGDTKIIVALNTRTITSFGNQAEEKFAGKGTINQ